MLTRKKSLRQSYADKLRREGIPQKARKPLRPVSAKRAVENREYSRRRLDFLRIHCACQIRTAHCLGLASEVHHRDGREGSLLNHEELWTATCRNCHQWVHQHSNQARELGFLV